MHPKDPLRPHCLARSMELSCCHRVGDRTDADCGRLHTAPKQDCALTLLHSAERRLADQTSHAGALPTATLGGSPHQKTMQVPCQNVRSFLCVVEDAGSSGNGSVLYCCQTGYWSAFIKIVSRPCMCMRMPFNMGCVEQQERTFLKNELICIICQLPMFTICHVAQLLYEGANLGVDGHCVLLGRRGCGRPCWRC